ncbi:MAG: hypothetical protein EZS28_028323 [Streblomastix strix]|uniref:Uncharacterized protein n=1 Tax=Streblomastix strix TaxID=222440 RepID=A0A5J4V098_9EUKA|nr:MAG: hypothetical protein EZS28_028323 [Streblomastix strix]
MFSAARYDVNLERNEQTKNLERKIELLRVSLDEQTRSLDQFIVRQDLEYNSVFERILSLERALEDDRVKINSASESFVRHLKQLGLLQVKDISITNDRSAQILAKDANEKLMVLANYDGSRVDVAGIATEFESRIKSIGQENREGVVILTENITNTLIEAQSLLNDEKQSLQQNQNNFQKMYEDLTQGFQTILEEEKNERLDNESSIFQMMDVQSSQLSQSSSFISPQLGIFNGSAKSPSNRSPASNIITGVTDPDSVGNIRPLRSRAFKFKFQQ